MIFFLIVLGDHWAKFSGRFFGAVVGAGLAVLLGADGIQAAVTCYDHVVFVPPAYYETERGFFVDPARKTTLSLRMPPPSCDGTGPEPDWECKASCRLQHEDGPIARVSFDYASTHGVCRDPATGLDHVLLHLSSGKYMEVQFWSVNPASGRMEQEYEEAWIDYSGDEVDISDRPLLVDAAGRCLWRERQQGHAVFRRALSALRVGQDATPLLLRGDATALPVPVSVPVRAIPTEVVRQHLLALDAIQPRMVEFGGAVYADEAGRAAWRVIQMTGTILADARGVVLVEDRRTGTWRTLYDILSGDGDHYSNHHINYPLESMVVAGNTLTAKLFVSGYMSGCFEIDLPTNRVTSRESGRCWEMSALHYSLGDGGGPEGEEKLFDLRKELGAD